MFFSKTDNVTVLSIFFLLLQKDIKLYNLHSPWSLLLEREHIHLMEIFIIKLYRFEKMRKYGVLYITTINSLKNYKEYLVKPKNNILLSL